VLPRLPLHGREAPENVPGRVLDQCQSGRVAVAAAVKGARAEAIAAAPPQQRKALPAGLREERRKVRGDQGSETRGRAGTGGRGSGVPTDEGAFGDQGSEARGRSRQRDGRGGGRRCLRGGGSGAASDEGASGGAAMKTEGAEGAGAGGLGDTAGDGRGPEARTASTLAASRETVEESSATSQSRWAARSSRAWIRLRTFRSIIDINGMM
jgi:hypothetical protein